MNYQKGEHYGGLGIYLTSGHGHDVFKTENNTVIKIPNHSIKDTRKAISDTLRGYDIHKSYLDLYCPKQSVDPHKKYGYIIEQKYIMGQAVEIITSNHPQLSDLITRGLEMQRKEKILFDPMGAQGAIQQTGKRLSKTKNFKSRIENQLINNPELCRNMIHIEAEQVIEDLNRGVVLANNILESANGIHMIDCELRRIGIMSPQDIAHWLNTFATRMILNKRSKYIQTVNMN